MRLASRTLLFLGTTLILSAPGLGAATPLQNPASSAPRLVLQLNDGTTRDASAALETVKDAYIVELDAPAAILLNARALQKESARSVLDRLEADLSRLSASARTSALGATEARITRRFSRVFSGAGVRLSPSMVSRVRQLPYVKRVVPERIVRTLQTDSVSSVGAPAIWSTYGTRGAGVVVAVIDTGIDYRHPALGGGFGSGFKVAGGHDFVNDDGDPLDDHGHGTHVAGIIASDLPGPLGVAPDVALLAYKVLSDKGEGKQEDVIAAIERAVDPNGDGDPSDAVDIVNMSLGAPGGSPDDPVTIAVENASAAGVLFCIAAGNDGHAFTIGSPGNAPSALTVGAADLDGTIASFSSRGPTRGDLLVKPEVVAPGVNIRSTFAGGGYKTLSGTSMATPHVTGVAALLRSVHPEWTAARIKSAIISTARDLGVESIAQGGGTVDAPAAALTPLAISPGTLTFARDPGAPAAWSAIRTLRISNPTLERKSLTLHADPAASGLTVSVDLPVFALEAGESRDIRVTVDADNAALPFPDRESMSYGGSIRIEDAGKAFRIPWNLVRAVSLTLRHDSDTPVATTAIVGVGKRHALATLIMPDETAELMLPGGSATIETITSSLEAGAPVELTFRDGIPIEADQTLDVRPRDAIHTIALRSTDENGHALCDAPPDQGIRYSTGAVVRWPSGSAFQSMTSYAVGPEILISDVPPRFNFTFFEVRFDTLRHEGYLIQHPSMAGITQSLTLAKTPADLVSRNVELQFPPAAPAPRLTLGHTLTSRQDPDNAVAISAWGAVDAPQSPLWKGRVVMNANEPSDADSAMGITFVGDAGRKDPRTPDIQFFTMPLSVVGRSIASFASRTPDAALWIGNGADPLRFGGSPVFSREQWTVTDHSFSLILSPTGPLGEVRANDLATAPVCALYDADDRRIGDCTATAPFESPAVNDLPAAGKYRVEVRIPLISTAFDSSLLLRDSFDTRLPDSTPPVLTSAQLVSRGELAEAFVPLGADARLRFSGIDREKTPDAVIYAPLAEQATRVEYRRSGSESWIAVPLQKRGTELGDAKDLGHRPAGMLYEADLSAATAAVGNIDVRIRMEDTTGNSAEWTLSPAFRVGGSRRRAVSE